MVKIMKDDEAIAKEISRKCFVLALVQLPLLGVGPQILKFYH
jgi:hypothetical protein